MSTTPPPERAGLQRARVSDGFWIAVSIVAGVALYVIVKVLYYARRSREQWQEVDRSKLREWDDDEEW